MDKLKKESKDKEDELKKNLEESKDKKNQNLLNFLKGAAILQRKVCALLIMIPWTSWRIKSTSKNLKYKLRSFLRTKKLSDNDSLRKYFNKWRNNVLKGIKPEALYKLLAKLIEITLNNYKIKILAKNSLKGEGSPGKPQILLKN